MTDHPDTHPDDELVDLALGHVDPERRAALGEHLLACPRCRAEHAELLAGIEAVAAAAPAVQPPLGFDQRVLARMTGAAPAPASPGPTRARRGLPVAAAVALLTLVLGVGVGLAVGGGGSSSDGDRVAALTTGAGADVGTATVTEVAGEPVLVVGLSEGVAGRTYTCRMRFADGTTLDTAPWAAAPGAGWLVPLPTGRGALTGIALVAPDGSTTWSTADLGG